MLGEISSENCIQKIPARLTYSASIYNLVLETNVHIPAPTYLNIIEEFSLGENTFLPVGLVLNSKTGEITGIPTQEAALNTYTIYGKNQVGTAVTTINLSVQKGTCIAKGVFPTTYVGVVYTYDCALGGSYVGTQKRACVLDDNEPSGGKWADVTGVCIATWLIVVLVFVVIAVIGVAIFFFVRVSVKAKAVGGVRGKPSSRKSLSKNPSNKSVSRTSSNKAVKV